MKELNELLDQINKDIDNIDIARCNEWEAGYRKGLMRARRYIQDLLSDCEGEDK